MRFDVLEKEFFVSHGDSLRSRLVSQERACYIAPVATQNGFLVRGTYRMARLTPGRLCFYCRKSYPPSRESSITALSLTAGTIL